MISPECVGYHAIEYLNSCIQREKLVEAQKPRREKEKAPKAERKFIELLGDCSDNIKKWWSLCLKSPDRKMLLEAKAGLTFEMDGKNRRIYFALAKNVKSLSSSGSILLLATFSISNAISIIK